MDQDHEQHDHGFDDETAEWYVKNYGDHPTNRLTVELAQLAPDDVVVDVGCGSGEAVREAALRLTRGRVIGVDPAPAMLRFARELTVDHEGQARIEYREAPAEKLPVTDGAATVVLAINSLHHWQDPEAGLAEVRRVLAPGGRLYLGEEEVGQGKFGHGEGQMANPDYVLGLLEGAGFVDVALRRHADSEVRMYLVAGHKSA
jgi:ubiquinone/menaquinone biosynthesis C-methylase UbiE